MKNPILTTILFAVTFTTIVTVSIIINAKLNLGIPAGIIPFMLLPFGFVFLVQMRKKK